MVCKQDLGLSWTLFGVRKSSFHPLHKQRSVGQALRSDDVRTCLHRVFYSMRYQWYAVLKNFHEMSVQVQGGVFQVGICHVLGTSHGIRSFH